MNWPTDLARRLPFGAAVALALGLHAFALLYVSQAQALPAGGRTTALMMFVRPVASTALGPESASAAAAAALEAAAQPAEPTPAAAATSVAPVQAPAQEAPVAQAGTVPGQPLPGSASRLPEFLPRSMLTAAPRPRAAVDVPFPKEVRGIVQLKVQATLFIDETGRMHRVRIDTPDVHPAFEKAIHETFAGAVFRPGEVAGQPVRSQLRVEVEFDAPQAADPDPGPEPGAQR